MPVFQLTTPIAFFIFNRPGTTIRVFEEIRRARPTKLLVVADGPRPDRPGEAEKCAATRAIVDQVDWPCEVLKNYSDINLGCKIRVSSGLDWVFEQVEEAIILEDDCLPHPTFFRFCQEMLNKYRYDKRIMMISGDNFQFNRKRTEYSYYYSRYCHIWGWASWRCAWQCYDVEMRGWPAFRDGGWLYNLFDAPRVIDYWTRVFEMTYRGDIDTWDYQWSFACWQQGALAIMPNTNLISNIGFGHDATRTTKENQFSNMPCEEMLFPLSHPLFVIRYRDADVLTEKLHYGLIPYWQRILRKIQL